MSIEERRLVFQGIAEIAAKDLEREQAIDPSLRLIEDLKLDSIRLLTLIVAVEDRFRICLDPDDEQELETVDDLIDLIVRKRAAGALESA